MWVQIAVAVVMMIVSYAITMANQPKPEKPQQGRLDIPTADEGAPIAVCFGTNVIKQSNCTWYGDPRVVPIRSKGGKK